MHRTSLRSCVVLRDGYHIYRVNRPRLLLRTLCGRVACHCVRRALSGIFDGMSSSHADLRCALSDIFADVLCAPNYVSVLEIGSRFFRAVPDVFPTFGIRVLDIFTRFAELGSRGPLFHSQAVECLGSETSIGIDVFLLLILADRGLRLRPVESIDRAGIIALVLQCLLRLSHRPRALCH